MILISYNELHDGWQITTSCQAWKATNGKPSDSTPCFASAEIRLIDPQQFEDGWKSVDPHTIPDEGNREFSGWVAAHKILIEESKQLIDSLKR